MVVPAVSGKIWRPAGRRCAAGIAGRCLVRRQGGPGPLGTWPVHLRVAAALCLRSRFPMVLTWGPELVMIYNDAYRELLGDKHPAGPPPVKIDLEGLGAPAVALPLPAGAPGVLVGAHTSFVPTTLRRGRNRFIGSSQDA